MCGEKITLTVLLRFNGVRRAGERLERNVEIGQTRIKRAIDSNVPANGDIRETTEGEVGLPFETLDVCRQEVRGREDDVGSGRGDPESG